MDLDQEVIRLAEHGAQFWLENLKDRIGAQASHEFIASVLDEHLAIMLRNAIRDAARPIVTTAVTSAVVRWFEETGVPLDAIPKAMRAAIVEEMRQVDAESICGAAESHEVRVYRMWLRGLTLKEMAKHAAMSEKAAKRLLKRAQNRVEAMREILAAYTDD